MIVKWYSRGYFTLRNNSFCDYRKSRPKYGGGGGGVRGRDKQNISWVLLAGNLFISWNHILHMPGLGIPTEINTKSTEITV